MSRILQKRPVKFKFHHFIGAVVIILLLASIGAKAQEINKFGYNNIGKQLSCFEDKTAKMSLSDVQLLNDTAFKKGQQEILNLGNTSSAWWIKFSYTAKPYLPLYLIIDAPNIEYIDAYVLHNGVEKVHLAAGALRAGQPNVLVRNNFMLNIPTATHSQKATVYLRLKTNNILVAPVKLASAESVMNGQEAKLSIEYIYIGLLIGLLLFNLFLFVSVRDVTYLYYVLYVLTLSAYLLIYIRGYAFIFGDDIRVIINRHPHVLLSFSVFASLLFCNKFLHLKRTAPKMINLFYAIGFVGLVLFVVSIGGFKHTATLIAQLLTVTVAVIAWIAGIVAYRSGHRPAKYYILAWFFIWITVAIVTMSLAGVIPSNEFTIQLVPIGSTIELLMLSFALGDRYKVIIKAERQARDENLLLVQTQNQRLEESVNQRTLQLNQTISKLEDSNAIKNKLFSIVAHDLRSPLNSLLGILSLNDMQVLSADELRELLAENKKTIKSINNTVNNLLHWAQSQMNGSVTQMERFDLKALLDELLLLYLPLVKKKSIQIQQNIHGAGAVTADQNQINLVMRNLIDNAIKFTPLTGSISFEIQPANGGVWFSIENEVANELDIDINNIISEKTAISTLGTQNENGVGLGLLLCQEYIKNNGGTFQAKLVGNRIKFSFLLPSEQPL